MLIDSHAHIYLPDFQDDRKEIMDRALQNGVRKILMPNIDHTTIEPMLEMAALYPEVCFPMIGLHPGSVKQDFEKELAIVESWLNKGIFVAIGEIGTDLYWDNTYIEEQKEAMKVQVQWAKKYNLPIVIHNRSSFEITLNIVQENNSEQLKGVFHCFTGTAEEARQIIDLQSFYMGIGGIVTFKNSGIDQNLQTIDQKHLLLETDSPYLAPVPKRGKRNEPSYTLFIAEKLADIYHIDVESIKAITSKNTKKLFNLD